MRSSRLTTLADGTSRVNGGLDLDACTALLGARSPVAPAPTNRINEL
jgi:hypothetical protein